MKRLSIPPFTLPLLAGMAFAACVVLSPGFKAQLKRWGKDRFYVYVVEPGKKILTGAYMKQRYEYRLPAVSESGAEKTLTFTADKQLSLDTYVRLYVSSAGKVTAWEEVRQRKLPNRIKNGPFP